MENNEGALYAVWDNMQCPKCGAYFVVQDQFGYFCAVNKCEWRQDFELPKTEANTPE